ncbi:hypothetical protein EWM64_g10773 [Hericium alpestre]|uniref:Helicase C-terminal domain-containing protein n=1 Tax=Hericium alpestre TaxID=135208 RepID=A0A4Y9ZGE0_9AGAM|nr:hypothetical protein EWM64_g10773 [Hericium alpestre]
MRPDIQLLIHVLTARLGGWNFPDLDWVLERNRKTIIFCKTILLGFRVMVYLWLRAPSFPDRATCIHSYNSLNSVTYNTRTQELMLTPGSRLQIIIATDSLSQGVNAPDIHDVITMGQPTNPDEFFQRIGRAGRDCTVVTDAQGMMYVPASAHKTAREVLGLADENPSCREKKLPEMHDGIAQLLLAPCLRKEQDLLYDNPSSDPPCTCPLCASHPLLSCSIPCNCSGCVIDPGDIKPKPVNFFIEDPASMFVTRPRCLKAHEITVARQHLIEHCWTVWEAADEVKAALEPPELYLPDEMITVLLERFLALDEPSDLDSLLQLNPYAQKGRDQLWATIRNI